MIRIRDNDLATRPNDIEFGAVWSGKAMGSIKVSPLRFEAQWKTARL